MTIGTNPDGAAAARRRAAEVLKVPEDASAAEARRAYLRNVRASDFLPPQSSHRALRVLDGTPALPGSDEEWLHEEECRLRAEAESFAEEFFTLPVAQRRERWDVLFSSCRHLPPLAARLQALKDGLEVETQGLALGDSLRGQLAEHLLRSFPLTPLARAAARQAFLHPIDSIPVADLHKAWEKAARHLLAEWPALAALDPVLVGHLANLRQRLARRSELHRRGQKKLQATGYRWQEIAWGTVFVVGFAAAAIIGLSNIANKSSTPRPPSPSFPTPRVVGTGPPLRELLDASKYDVEVVNPGTRGRIFEFKPRLGSVDAGSNGRPLVFGEASLILMGVTREQLNALSSRAVSRGPDGVPKPTPPK